MRPTGPAPEAVALSAADGTRLAGRFWPGTAPRGILVIAHGLGEHAGCYDRSACDLSARPGLVDVLAFDFRGHGLSAGRRGVVRRYEDLLVDLDAALSWASRERAGRPRFVLGHSNGGQVVLRHALEMPGSEPAGLILSNPALALATAVAPRWKVAVGKVLHRVAPGVTLSVPLSHEQMTRDESCWPERLGDPLRHGRICAPMFFGMVEGGARIVPRAEAIRLPILLLLGASDPVIRLDVALEFFDRLGTQNKVLHIYPEMLHEPLNELGRERVLDDLAAWLTLQLDQIHP